MKVLFINEVLYREKFQKLFLNEKKERDSYPFLVNLNDSQYSTENLLKELEVNKEIIDEILRTDIEDNLLIVLNDGIKFNGQKDHLNFDLKKSGIINYKSFNVDLDKEEVYVNNKRVKLTALEYKLVLFFLNNITKLITREQIIDYLWNNSINQTATEHNLYTHIKNLKKKLSKTGIGNFIHSMYGQGYIFQDPEEVV